MDGLEMNVGRDRLDLLTEREREVLAFIAQGYSVPEIARKLFRSKKTIQTHRLSIGRKLNLRNRVELARLAIECGLVHLRAGEASVPTGEANPYRLIFQQAPCPAMLWRIGAHGQDFALVDYNRAAEVLVGPSLAKFLGQPLSQIAPARVDLLAALRRCVCANEPVAVLDAVRPAQSGRDSRVPARCQRLNADHIAVYYHAYLTHTHACNPELLPTDTAAVD